MPVDQLQLRQPNRDQFTYAAIDVERLVPADHLVRAIWELSGMLDLSGFAAHLETRKESAGRPAWDPRLLVAIWIWAYSERMSSAREIARQSRYRPELEWLCGMAVVNHHTLSDFRVFHSNALENLLTQVLALLSQEGLVDLEQVAVDGTRIRAQASGGSQRRRPTLERHLEQAREAVRQLSEEADDEGSNRRRQAARKRTLTYQRSSLKRKRKYRQYQAKASDCRECAQRHKCCPKSGHRTLSRSEENAVMAKHRRWMESERGRAAYRKRSETAEFPNAWLKERFGVRKFRVRGLRKARSELLWGVLAYNIAAWIRLVWRRGPECGLAAQAAA